MKVPLVKDCIAALATPVGQGAIGVIRISGESAIALTTKLFSNPAIHQAPSHTAHYGKILSNEGQVLDHVVVLIMRAPRSYTGENTVEISCHGGMAVIQRILSRIYEAGARPAQPGEFSLRAFLNGKIDLAQAEAVQMLISAKNEEALQNAEKQLEGRLSKKIHLFQKELTHLLAVIEAWVDFPEEGLEFMQFDEMLLKLQTIREQMHHLQQTFHEGKMMQEGISLCLVGTPNVGKSSLMNALLNQERAIVTDTPGTTRDLLQEDLRLGSLHFKLIDTAGIRQTEERIELEGIRRSRKAFQEADIILLLLDASRGLSQEDKTLLDELPKEKTLVVWNKIDLAKAPLQSGELSISARTQQGLDKLKQAIEALLWKKGAPEKEEVLITSHRAFSALTSAIHSLDAVIYALTTNVSAEWIASDLRQSLLFLGQIIGTNVTEDVLSALFSQFCVGK